MGDHPSREEEARLFEQDDRRRDEKREVPGYFQQAQKAAEMLAKLECLCRHFRTDFVTANCIGCGHDISLHHAESCKGEG